MTAWKQSLVKQGSKINLLQQHSVKNAAFRVQPKYVSKCLKLKIFLTRVGTYFIVFTFNIINKILEIKQQ